jgi:hypothetical protein
MPDGFVTPVGFAGGGDAGSGGVVTGAVAGSVAAPGAGADAEPGAAGVARAPLFSPHAAHTKKQRRLDRHTVARVIVRS